MPAQKHTYPALLVIGVLSVLIILTINYMPTNKNVIGEATKNYGTCKDANGQPLCGPTGQGIFPAGFESCYCDPLCSGYGDCCADYDSVCGPAGSNGNYGNSDQSSPALTAQLDGTTVLLEWTNPTTLVPAIYPPYSIKVVKRVNSNVDEMPANDMYNFEDQIAVDSLHYYKIVLTKIIAGTTITKESNEVSVSLQNNCADNQKVCGSNGQTYNNRCLAAFANQQVACNKECPCSSGQGSGTVSCTNGLNCDTANTLLIGYNPNQDYAYISPWNWATMTWKNLIIGASGGNVGIGTTTPQAKLHVKGMVAIGSSGSPVPGKLLCWKSDGKIGYCTSINSDGTSCQCETIN